MADRSELDNCLTAAALITGVGIAPFAIWWGLGGEQEAYQKRLITLRKGLV